MRFTIEVEECHGPWQLVDTQHLAEGITRTKVRCSCGHTRILTVTSLRATEGHEAALEVA